MVSKNALFGRRKMSISLCVETNMRSLFKDHWLQQPLVS